MEKYTWASDISLSAPFLIATGHGHLSWRPDEDLDALGSPADIVAKKLPGHLLCASTLLEIRDASASRWLMLAPETTDPSKPGLWQFPMGYLTLGDLPLQCAMRNLARQVQVLKDGVALSWGTVGYRVGGPAFDWLTQDAVHSGVRLRYVQGNQTVVFYYHAVMEVADLEDLSVQDNTRGGRRVALLTEADVKALQAQARVGGLSSLQWRAFGEEREAQRLKLRKPGGEGSVG